MTDGHRPWTVERDVALLDWLEEHGDDVAPIATVEIEDLRWALLCERRAATEVPGEPDTEIRRIRQNLRRGGDDDLSYVLARRDSLLASVKRLTLERQELTTEISRLRARLGPQPGDPIVLRWEGRAEELHVRGHVSDETALAAWRAHYQDDTLTGPVRQCWARWSMDGSQEGHVLVTHEKPGRGRFRVTVITPVGRW